MGDFGAILMFATDNGIAAQLPYLRKLIDDYNQCRIRTRRIHLIWQLRDLCKREIRIKYAIADRVGDECIASNMINDALDEDTMDKGYIKPSFICNKVLP